MIHTSKLLFLVLLVTCAANIPSAWSKDATASLEGRWTAPSLSNPKVQIVFALLSEGKATEEVGSYRGTGTWKLENNAARIHWGSGWVGVLRPATRGGYELLTWKAKTLLTAPPDDIQPAKRLR
ncbi:MAG: hypothetical protein ABI443_04070 [Chthoniobacterales bacterium]